MSRTVAQRFRRERPLGEGRTGRVWEAWDEALGQTVALKELRDEDAGYSPVAAARLRREAQIGSRLRHQNLVHVHDVIEVDGQWPVLVMEIVTGHDLHVRSASGGVPWQVLGAWIVQVADALAYLHDEGFLHRDVKPANILVGAGGETKLGDLGIARHHDDPRLTSTGLIPGTFNYLAPEVSLSFEQPTTASDVWSLGATILTTVAPAPTYDHRSEAHLAAIRERIRHWPETTSAEVDYLLAAGLQPRAAELVGRMLSDNPDSRPSAADVLAELRVALATDPDAGRVLESSSRQDIALAEVLYRVFVVGDLHRRLATTALRPFTTWSAPGSVPEVARLSGSELYERWSSTDLPYVITGDSGSGKSTAALLLVARILDNLLRTGDGPLALHVSVAGWLPSWGSLKEWVSKESALRTRRDPKEYAALISEGAVVIVLDQADELDPASLRAFGHELDSWAGGDTSSPRPVLCCQPGTLARIRTFAMSFLTEDRHAEAAVHRLDADEIDAYLRAHGAISPGTSPNTEEWTAIREHLDTPVRLVAAVEAFGERPLDQALNEIGLEGFWSAYYDARLRQAAQSSVHPAREVRRWLTWTARHTKRNETFWLSDGHFARPVRWTLIGLGPLIGLTAALTYFFLRGHELSAEIAVAACLIVVGPVMCFHSIGDGRMRYLRLSNRRLKRGLRRGLVMAATTSCIAAFAMPPGVAVACGCGFGFLLAVRSATAVQYVSSNNTYAGNNGRELIAHALRSGFIFGPLYGLSVGAPLAYLEGVPFGLSWGFFWLCLGGHGGYLHHMLWRTKERLVRSGPPVFGLVRCLEWCITKDLLVADGASPGYRFPHLQQWTYFHGREGH